MKENIRLLSAGLLLCTAAVCADIHGVVVSSGEQKPLKRAEVVLRSPEPGGQPKGVLTGDDGRFAFYDVSPGRYGLFVSRTGYAPTSTGYRDKARLNSPFSVDRDIENLTVRLLPAATISGKVRFSDGEPAPRITVEAYLDTWQRNRHMYLMAGRAVSDDRGEYRLYGLPSGRYVVAAVFLPFGGRSDVDEPKTRDTYGNPVPPERPVSTFYPSSPKLSEATQLTVGSGSEIGTADIFMATARTSALIIRVLNGSDGQAPSGASVSLLWQDGTGTGFLPCPGVARMRNRNEWEIRGVTAGRYALDVAGTDASGGLHARQLLTIGNAQETSVNVLVQPMITVRGMAFPAQPNKQLPAGITVVAEPRTPGGASGRASVQPDGAFSLRIRAGETYDMFLGTAPEKMYLKSATIDSADILNGGMRLDSSGNASLTLTLDDRGAEAAGEAQPGAVVTLIPENGVLSHFAETQANEWGIFTFTGISPGRYQVVPWFDEPPCELWNPELRSTCTAFGKPLVVDAGGYHTLSVRP